MFIINFCLNMFRASLCPSSGEQRLCYCKWCTALVLLDVVGSGCGGLRCRMWALWRLLFNMLRHKLIINIWLLHFVGFLSLHTSITNSHCVLFYILSSMESACVMLYCHLRPTLYHKRHDFHKSLLKKKCFLSETLSILRRIPRDIITNVHTGPYVKCLLFLSQFNETWIFLTKFLQTLKCKISWKSSS